MSLRRPDPRTDFGLQTMTIPTICVLCEVFANCYIVWFLLIDLPFRCARLAAMTGGSRTCGLEIGSYVVTTISAIMILVGVYYLAAWHFPQQE